VARELHDELSQKLALLSMDIDQVLGSDHTARTAIAAQLKAISARSNEIASDVHRLSHELHPAKLRVLGLVAAIDAVCRDTSRQHPVVVEFTHGDVPRLVGPEPSLCLYRITQEALYNVVRHSGASRALVRLAREDDELHLQIVDSGSGFVRRDDELTGLGLVSMRERVAFLGGTIAIQSAPGEGTGIDVRVPLHVAASAPLPRPAETA
jgi:signal transduction histidine kinase